MRKYVDITSGVGAGAGVRLRDLIGRLFTTNELVPTKSLVEFTTVEEVGDYFGTSSEEYKRAQFYFSFISKSITRAKRIAFARWADVATAPQVFGTTHASLATLEAIEDGSFTISLGGTENEVTLLDFSGALSLAAVAAIIQTAIRAEEVDALWASATVTYDATRNAFNFEGGATGVNAITVSAGVTGTNILTLFGWGAGAILSDGVAIETVTDTLTESSEATNNFGSFLFMPTLTIEEIEEAAAWNATQNILYQYMVPVAKSDAVTYYAALQNYAGVAVTVSETADEYPEMIPMTLLAATDYTRRNSTQNYMYQIFNVTPSVTNTTESNNLDAQRVNYYGRTQTAGQFIDFYQRGLLMGLPVNPSDQNVYANEQWLKDAAGASIMELLLNLPKVSANARGRGQLLSQLQSVINQALFNGTISVGKELTNTQKLYISELSGDPQAWQQVVSIGYWIDAVIERRVSISDAVEYVAVYTLIYSKDDTIRKVEGSHVLI
jgi:hypothetical protein